MRKFRLLGYTSLENGKYRKSEQDFAIKAIFAFIDEGIMLDICDWGRISYISKENEEKKIINTDEVLSLLDKSIFSTRVVPRNISYESSKYIFYDTYPTKNFNDDIPLRVRKRFYKSLINKDLKDIATLIKNSKCQEQLELCIRYIGLLLHLAQ